MDGGGTHIWLGEMLTYGSIYIIIDNSQDENKLRDLYFVIVSFDYVFLIFLVWYSMF